MKSSRLIPAVLLSLATATMADPPDLTAGEEPSNDVTTNLGPTGMRGWVYHEGKQDTTNLSRQILVTEVDSGSPADGVIAADDVILGANGSGTEPAAFSSDARRSLATAIAAAEARDPATLNLLRWRGGSTETVTVTLRTMGAYSDTAPYNCPKSAKILADGLEFVANHEDSGRYAFGNLTLLASGNPLYLPDVRQDARALVPSTATMEWMMSDEPDTTAMICWERGHTLIFLAEYYLATGDDEVLPAIEAYAVNIARNQSLYGTVGHKFADKWDDGSDNGPMGGVYGVVNSSGLPCFYGMLLARKCGLENPYLDAAIARTSKFFAYYSGKGSIPYGEHEPGSSTHESNGKSGLAALAFSLLDDRTDEARFFAKMATAATSERERGHTGTFFHYLWAPLGANVGGDDAAAAHFSRISWHLDLARNWDGSFDYDCLNGEGPDSGSEYYNFRMSTAALLLYSLPQRNLCITGRDRNDALTLSSGDIAEANAADDYDASTRSSSELVDDLASWSPKTRTLAATEMSERGADDALRDELAALALDPDGDSRPGACLALGKVGDADSAATLASLLTDPDAYVRFMAADAMRYLPDAARNSQLETALSATESTAVPLFPIHDDDPLEFAHGRLVMFLFHNANHSGPKGILASGFDGVDRDLLYPAVRAASTTPIGICRAGLGNFFLQLEEPEVQNLADALLDAVMYRSTADKMFSEGVRLDGLEVLRKFDIAEGVPLCQIVADNDGRGWVRRDCLAILQTYAGSVTTVQPDPQTTAYLNRLIDTDSSADEARAVLDAIAADTAPTPLTAFKSIHSATADSLTLLAPATSTTLRVDAVNHDSAASTFTWTTLSGPGSVSFEPNATAAAADCLVTVDTTPGTYQFEVTMTDTRGLTETSEIVTVRFLNEPDTSAPTLLPENIVDDAGGGPVFEGDVITYTVTFSEAIDPASISSADFELVGTAAATIRDIQVDGAAVLLTVAPNGVGTITLQLRADASPLDLAGNAFATGSPVADDTGIQVKSIANLLFADNFNRDNSTDPNASADGKSGTLGPLQYTARTFSSVTLDINANSLRINGPASSGSYGGLVFINDHNFTDAVITTGGGFSIEVDISAYSTAGSSRQMAVGAGQSLADLMAQTGAAPADHSSDLLVAYRDTDDALEIYKNGVLDEAETVTSGLPDDPTTMRINYAFSDFAAGSEVTYTVVFDSDTTPFTSGSFTWSGTAENYISLSSNLSNDSRFDNLAIWRNSGPLVAHWTMDDNAGGTLADSSGNGFDATIQDGSPVGGIDGSAIRFDGTASSAVLPASAFDSIDDEITIALWAYGSLDQPRKDSIFYAVNETGDRVLNIHLPWSDSTVYWDAGQDAGYDRIQVAADPQEYRGRWNHWAFTKNAASGEMNIYLNGRLVREAGGKTKTITGISAATLGSQTGGMSYQGAIDEVKLYNVALDPVEIDAIYQQSAANADYAGWSAVYSATELSDPSADSDDDGLTNAEERIWGLDPTSAASANPYTGMVTPTGTFSYTRRDPALTGLDYSIWTSTNLSDWAEDASAVQTPGDPDENDIQTVEVTLSSTPAGGRLFVRIQAD